MPLPNEIQTGRFNRMLQRFFNIQSYAPSPQLASEVSPQFDLGNPPLENHWLLNERSWGAAFNLGAVAAQSGVLQLLNPLGSGVLVTVEQAVLSCGAAAGLKWAVHFSGDALTVRSSFPRDTRASRGANLFQPPASIFSASTEAAVAGDPQAFGFVLVTANTPVYLTDVVVLTPGWALQMWSTTVNQQVTGHFWYRERPVLPMELAD